MSRERGNGRSADHPEAPLLFDKCIGRKRDVGGGVLAGLCLLGWVFGVKLKAWLLG